MAKSVDLSFSASRVFRAADKRKESIRPCKETQRLSGLVV